jgi:hypothetical protein
MLTLAPYCIKQQDTCHKEKDFTHKKINFDYGCKGTAILQYQPNFQRGKRLTSNA